jgi:riboflavin transporter FmnP
MSPLRQMTVIAILAAFGAMLMRFELPLFAAAPYLKYDPGDMPVLIGAFAIGPLTGVAVALLKNLLYLTMFGTPDQWFVGAPMNFLAGASFALCAGNIYFLKKTKLRAILSLIAGALFSTLVMLGANVLVLPLFMRMFMPAAPSITTAFLLSVILPFNLLKSALNGVLVFVVYKRISPTLKAARFELPARSPRAARPAL